MGQPAGCKLALEQPREEENLACVGTRELLWQFHSRYICLLTELTFSDQRKQNQNDYLVGSRQYLHSMYQRSNMLTVICVWILILPFTSCVYCIHPCSPAFTFHLKTHTCIYCMLIIVSVIHWLFLVLPFPLVLVPLVPLDGLKCLLHLFIYLFLWMSVCVYPHTSTCMHLN